MERAMARVWVAAAVLIAGCALVGAQEADLVTDRPDFTESGVVVPSGSVQLEAGLTWESIDDGDVDTLAGPEALIRWGFFEGWELRVGLPDYTDVVHGSGKSGWEDASVGFKWQLGPVSDWDVALIAEASLPTGADHRSSDAVDPLLILIAGKDLSDTWSFGTQAELGRPTVDDARLWVYGATAVVGYGVSDTLGTFFELKAEKEEHVDAAVLLHHGWTYLLSDTLQLDCHLGAGLSDSAPDWLFGIGFSTRF